MQPLGRPPEVQLLRDGDEIAELAEFHGPDCRGRAGGASTLIGPGRTRERVRTLSEAHDGVVVYWRPLCPFCMKLRTELLLARLPHTRVNIWRDPEAAAFVRSVADGNETVPTVTVAGRALVNPSLRQLKEAVGRYAPHLLSPGSAPR
ncbi:glutaredoxin domain-containing protein [Streptomyces sp. NPDC046759]|uniref:glutaredoxin domain-containing protein n=1 Tax=Streptomyces sp. NPDC046759 TaxID=3155019 RepID=UPI0033C4DA40